jgi:hypothetical protein
MAAFRYYADTEDGQCLLFAPGEIQHDPPGMARGLYGRRAGIWHRITRSVRYASNPSGHVCNARCQAAASHICECSCNGRNHGRFSSAPRQTAPAAPTLFACF